MQVTAISMQSILVGHDLNGCAFVYGSLSFMDKISCGIALYILESYQSTSHAVLYCAHKFFLRHHSLGRMQPVKRLELESPTLSKITHFPSCYSLLRQVRVRLHMVAFFIDWNEQKQQWWTPWKDSLHSAWRRFRVSLSKNKIEHHDVSFIYFDLRWGCGLYEKMQCIKVQFWNVDAEHAFRQTKFILLSDLLAWWFL